MKNTIAVCVVRMDEEFQSDALRAICARAEELNMYVQVYNTFEELVKHDLYEKGEESVFELIDYERICGIILFCEKIKDNNLNQRIIDKGKEYRIPVVAIDRDMEECCSITFDYKNSFEMIVRHLMEVHKCRSLFVMAGMRNNTFSDERIDAVRRVAAEYGVVLRDEDVAYGEFWEGPTKEELNRFFASGRPLPDVFIAANDTMAITICDELTRRGYRVPEDVIVTGFDGIEMERYYVPRLTTAQQDFNGAMNTAFEMICKIRDGEKQVDKHPVIPFAVRIGQSCGCKPIEYSSVSLQISSMYLNMTATKYFNKTMHDMTIDMTGKKTIGAMLPLLSKYIPYFDGYRHIYICLREFLLEGDKNLMAQINDRNRNLKGDREHLDMVLAGEWHEDGGFTMPLTRFDSHEFLPEYDTLIKEMKYVVFIPLHMQDIVFGYMVLNLDPNNNNYHQLNNFSISLSHCMDTVRQTQKMRKVNEQLTLANDKLEELYIRDPLTSIYNRRGFYQEVKRMLKKYKYGWVVMASVDLDGLKYINDNFGHGEGDFAIKSIGRAIASCSAENGICARFGGDEFSAALFFNEYEAYAERDFEQKLIEYIDKVNETSGKPYQIGASCGTEMGMIDNNLDLDALLKAADDKMYSNKEEHHRNVRQKSREE